MAVARWDKATELRIWETIPADQPHGSLEVMKEKLKAGDAAEARVKGIDLAVQAKPLRKHGTNQHSKEAGGSGALSPKGRGAKYLTARLARDFLEIHERMQMGEFKSVADAAREAGFYHPNEKPQRITASPDKGRLAQSLLQAYGPDGCEELIGVFREAIAKARDLQD